MHLNNKNNNNNYIDHPHLIQIHCIRRYCNLYSTALDNEPLNYYDIFTINLICLDIIYCLHPV